MNVTLLGSQNQDDRSVFLFLVVCGLLYFWFQPFLKRGVDLSFIEEQNLIIPVDFTELPSDKSYTRWNIVMKL